MILYIGIETIMEKVRRFLCNNQEIAQFIDYLEKKHLLKEQGDARRVLVQAQKNFYVTDGVLYYENANSDRKWLVAPRKLRKEVMRKNHEAVLQDIFACKKMFSRLSQYYYWPGMWADVQKVCENCVVCASTQGQNYEKTHHSIVYQLVSHLNV